MTADNTAPETLAVDRTPMLPPSPRNGYRGTSRLPLETSPRRTPRRSVIVVLTDNHKVAPELIDSRLPTETDRDHVDVILACAGQPKGIGSLPSRIRDVQLVLAPAGTSGEDLRQMAMQHAAGDIVTLVSGIPV